MTDTIAEDRSNGATIRQTETDASQSVSLVGRSAAPADVTASQASLLLPEQEMLLEEEKFLWPDGKPSFRAGLALSAGGVRAATVALGVLQVMASRDLLGKFHYLSTVSGGGYIGSALSWFWCDKRVQEESALSQVGNVVPVRFGADPQDFPFQEPGQNPGTLNQRAAENLEFLRNHGSYLTSGDGIGFAGLIVAVLRTILLSLVVWLPILIALFVLFEVVDQKLGPRFGSACKAPATTLEVLQCRPSFALLLVVAGTLLFVFFAAVILFSFLGRLQIDSAVPGTTRSRRYTLAALYILLGAACLVGTIATFTQLNTVHPAMGVQILVLALGSAGLFMLAVAEVFSPANRGYFLRRSFEKWSSLALPNVVAALFIGALPLIVANLPSISGQNSSSLGGALGPLGAVLTLLSGVGTALYGYYLKAKSILPGVTGQILAMAGSLLFLSGLLLCSFVVASAIVPSKAQNDPSALVAAPISKVENDPSVVVAAPIVPSKAESDFSALRLLIDITFLSLAVLALAIGLAGSVNATGLHRFYRDRLMETFMPMTGAVEQGTARQSDVADSLSVADLMQKTTRGNRPYHLVNAHAIMVNDPDPKVALRGGDNFLISPAFVGSSATGWMRTRAYLERHGSLTLASAMAASGAATNANAGYIGTGLTRDRFVSAVMGLLNIRLGLWVGNPGAFTKSARKIAAASKTPQPRFRLKTPTFFRPVLTCGIFGFGHHRAANFLELSDGGHFENLGLYELVRRELDLIVVVDAEQDSAISLSALVSSTNRIREDFGATVRFLDGKGPEMLLGRQSDRYPSGALIAKSPFVAAEIRYASGRRGALVYIKSCMMTGLEFATAGYRATNPEFPHQNSSDQFFDPDEFEAYRDLGKKSCDFMIQELNLGKHIGDADRLLAHYGFPSAHPPQGAQAATASSCC